VELRRPHPTADFDEVLALVQACDRAVYGDSDWTAEELREEWDGLDVGRDAWVAVEEGRLAGVMHVYERRGGRVLADGYVHPDLTGRGAGALLLNYPKRLGDWGWIGTLGVRPAWRRRGLGLALLYESFRRFAERGETLAALGVDSENPTGATRLYERAGMRVLWRADVWRKELRARD
jgi:ribosomal protein S18 acetylase RimI-like enzyme